MIMLNVPIHCPECADRSGGQPDCPTCGGTGEVRQQVAIRLQRTSKDPSGAIDNACQSTPGGALETSATVTADEHEGTAINITLPPLRQLKHAPLQRMMEEQGHLVVARWGADPNGPERLIKGEVLPRLCGGCGYYGFDGPVYVIGEATREEFEEQRQRYLEPVGPLSTRIASFAKVFAE